MKYNKYLKIKVQKYFRANYNNNSQINHHHMTIKTLNHRKILKIKNFKFNHKKTLISNPQKQIIFKLTAIKTINQR